MDLLSINLLMTKHGFYYGAFKSNSNGHFEIEWSTSNGGKGNWVTLTIDDLSNPVNIIISYFIKQGNGSDSGTLPVYKKEDIETILKNVIDKNMNSTTIEIKLRMFKKVLSEIELADMQYDKDKAANLHQERRLIKAELAKLGVEVHS
jgi:hypothetical protein